MVSPNGELVSSPFSTHFHEKWVSPISILVGMAALSFRFQGSLTSDPGIGIAVLCTVDR